jgi:uncharacterized protein (DUF1330 family)
LSAYAVAHMRHVTMGPAFPDRSLAHAWYNSDAYQAIVALRTDHSQSDIIVVDGVDSEHRATDLLEASR